MTFREAKCSGRPTAAGGASNDARPTLEAGHVTGSPRRRLPTRLPPVAGESFSSYAERLAHGLNVPLITLLAHTGVAPVAHWRAVPSAYGVHLEATPLASFAHVTGVPADVVRSMLLSRYDGIALDFSSVGDLPVTPGYAARIGWAYTSGSHYCPLCLAESGAWQVCWKLPWSFACVRHGLIHHGQCWACGRRSGSGRRGEAVPAYLGRVPAPGMCAALGPTNRDRGRAAQPCGAALRDAAVIPLIDAAVAHAQGLINDVLQGAQPIVFGARVRQLAFFHDLRSIVSVLLLAAHTTDLALSDPILVTAMDHHVAGRTKLFRERPRGVGRWAGRYYTGVPEDPALLAATVPTALRILTSASLHAAVSELGWMAERLAVIPTGTLPLPSWFRLSPRLQPLFTAADPERRYAAHERGRSGAAPIEARHVPQLLWQPIFERDFADLMPHIRPEKARLFCSLALVKWTLSLSWPRAAQALDLPVRASTKLAYDAARKLELAGGAAEFARRIDALSRLLAATYAHVDYRARRLALHDMHSLDDLAWAKAWAPGTPPSLSRARRRALTAWLWAELTGSDYRQAPVWRGTWGAAERVAYRRLLAASVDHMRPQAARYGTYVLSTECGRFLPVFLFAQALGKRYAR